MNCIAHPVISRLLCAALLLISGVAQAAVEFAVDVNPGSARPSQRALVEITVSNTGSTVETGLVVELEYPANVTSLSESLVTGPLDLAASCIQNGSGASCTAGELLIWNLGPIFPGQARVLTLPPVVTSIAPDGASIPWNVTVSDGGGTLGTDSATLTVDADAALTVSIDEDQDPVPSGGTLTYTLRYGNRTASNSTFTSLSLALPANTTLVSATGGGTLDGSTNTVNWNLGTLSAGKTGQQVVVVTVGSVANGTLLESAATIDGFIGGLPTDRRATETAYVGAATPLAMALDVNPRPARPSQRLQVKLTVTNPTGSTVTGGVVQLRYPARLFSLSESLVSGPLDVAASCGQAGSNASCTAGELLFWNLGPMVPGQVRVLTLPPEVISTAVGGMLIGWKATVTDDSGALATEAATLPVDETSPLSLSVDEDRDPVPSGGTLTYTVHYGNRSGSNITFTDLSLALPANTTLVSATGGGTLDGPTNTVNWSLGTLGAGKTGRQVVVVTVDSLADGTLLQSLAEIDGTSGGLPTARYATETTYVGPATPLAMALDVTPQPARPSQRLQVELTVTNPTSLTVTGGVVRLRYPARLFSLSESLVTGPLDVAASCGQAGSAGSCTAGEILIWNLGPMAPGQARVLTLPPQVLSTAVGGMLIPWNATITDDSGALGMESATLPVDAATVLTLSIDEDRDPVPSGGTLNYLVTYGNRSGSNVTGTTLDLSFSLPLNTTFVSASGGAAYDAASHTVTWDLPTLLAGAVAQQLVEVTVDGGLVNGTLLESKAAINGLSGGLPTARYATETAYVRGTATPLALALNVTPLPALTSQQLQVELTVTNPTGLLVTGGQVQLRYPTGLFSLSEGDVTGPLDAAASCGQAGSDGSCTAGELLIWNLGPMAPGQKMDLTFPPQVLSTTGLGRLIRWEATVTEDTSSLGFASETLPITNNFTPPLFDFDLDGITDDADNCINQPNGPSIPDAGGNSQLDTDGDNIGNACDCDFNQDNFCGGPDFTTFIGCFNAATGGIAACEAADMNGDGFVGGPDFSLFIGGFNGPPGPSGLVP